MIYFNPLFVKKIIRLTDIQQVDKKYPDSTKKAAKVEKKFAVELSGES